MLLTASNAVIWGACTSRGLGLGGVRRRAGGRVHREGREGSSREEWRPPRSVHAHKASRWRAATGSSCGGRATWPCLQDPAAVNWVFSETIRLVATCAVDGGGPGLRASCLSHATCQLTPSHHHPRLCAGTPLHLFCCMWPRCSCTAGCKAVCISLGHVAAACCPLAQSPRPSASSHAPLHS